MAPVGDVTAGLHHVLVKDIRVCSGFERTINKIFTQNHLTLCGKMIVGLHYPLVPSLQDVSIRLSYVNMRIVEQGLSKSMSLKGSQA